MRFEETPKFADPKAALARLLQIAMAGPRNAKGQVAVSYIEKTFRDEGASLAEYAQAMATATGERWLIVDAGGTHVTPSGVDRRA